MTDTRSPLHMGGPLGLAGLAMLAGATGIFVMAGSGGSSDVPREARQIIAEKETMEAAPPARPGETRPMVQPAELPASAETRTPAPVKMAQADAGAEVVFIVRIKGEPEIDVISRNFKRDPAAAQIAWSNLQSRHPVLRDFRLVGASYSGEIRLGYTLPPGLEPTRAAINDIQNRILQVESVSYADPDYVAQAGKE